MLIPLREIVKECPLQVKGVLHIGAHECEERNDYHKILKIPDSKILWIEANRQKVKEMQKKIPGVQILEAVVSNNNTDQVTFYHTNNCQSSAVLYCH